MKPVEDMHDDIVALLENTANLLYVAGYSDEAQAVGLVRLLVGPVLDRYKVRTIRDARRAFVELQANMLAWPPAVSE